VTKLRRWIEVPIPRTGVKQSVPFPVGCWDRLLQLHRAIYKHGFTKAFGSIEDSWNLLSKTRDFTGVHEFWGRGNSQSAACRRLVALSKRAA